MGMGYDFDQFLRVALLAVLIVEFVHHSEMNSTANKTPAASVGPYEGTVPTGRPVIVCGAGRT
jgi:hypothetical protein